MLSTVEARALLIVAQNEIRASALHGGDAVDTSTGRRAVPEAMLDDLLNRDLITWEPADGGDERLALTDAGRNALGAALDE